MNSKRIKQIKAFIFMMFLVSMLIIAAIVSDLKHDYLSDIYVGCRNSVITVKWKVPLINKSSGIKITIEGEGKRKSIIIPAYRSQYTYDECYHGEKYRITLVELYNDGTQGQEIVRDILCYDETQLPDLPVLNIQAVNYVEPTYLKVEAPDGLSGSSIIQNEYVGGVIKYYDDSSVIVNSSVQVRVRGNTSSTCHEKKSYKICLPITTMYFSKGSLTLSSEGNSLSLNLP